ncbi:MAG: hypothetical protein JST38_18020 [Bacteroidetes bacterium]|nr:hypothetical protein [Bacteroidota bacterium]
MKLVGLQPKMAQSARLILIDADVHQRYDLAQVKLASEEVVARYHWPMAAEPTALAAPDDIPYAALALMHKCQI